MHRNYGLTRVSDVSGQRASNHDLMEEDELSLRMGGDLEDYSFPEIDFSDDDLSSDEE